MSNRLRRGLGPASAVFWELRAMLRNTFRAVVVGPAPPLIPRQGAPRRRIGPVIGIAVLAGCAARISLPLPGNDPLPSARGLDVDRVRARLDRDGDGGFDQDLPMAAFTFNHAPDIMPFIQAAKVEALHARLSFDTSTDIVIPAGHPVDSLLEVLLSEKAMAAHGLRVLADAADAVGLPEVGDVLAYAGRDQSVEEGETVALDGSGSLSFVDGAELSYAWSQIEGQPAELIGADSVRATFTAPVVAEETVFTFRLIVSTGDSQDRDEVLITVAPSGGDEGGEGAPGDPVAGQTAFLDNGCGACHADDATGGMGPALLGDQTAALQERFSGGADHLGTTLTEAEITDIAAWLATLEP